MGVFAVCCVWSYGLILTLGRKLPPPSACGVAVDVGGDALLNGEAVVAEALWAGASTMCDALLDVWPAIVADMAAAAAACDCIDCAAVTEQPPAATTTTLVIFCLSGTCELDGTGFWALLEFGCM